MPIRAIFMAHAETDATRRGVFPSNETLNARGRDATRRLAGTLPAASPVLTSPAPAACETAQALGLAATVDPTLRDLDVGSWAGRSVMDIGMADAESATAWIDDPAFAGHGGESIEDLIRRIGAWLAARQSDDGIVVAITHAAVLRAAAIAALGAPSTTFWRIDAAPLSTLTLSSDGRRWSLRALEPPKPKDDPAKL